MGWVALYSSFMTLSGLSVLVGLVTAKQEGSFLIAATLACSSATLVWCAVQLARLL